LEQSGQRKIVIVRLVSVKQFATSVP
jgi:hypothetical protein